MKTGSHQQNYYKFPDHKKMCQIVCLVWLSVMWTPLPQKREKALCPTYFLIFHSMESSSLSFQPTLTMTCMGITLNMATCRGEAIWSLTTCRSMSATKWRSHTQTTQAPQHPQPSMTDKENQNGGVARTAGKGPGFKTWFLHLLAMGAWASYLTFLCLSFLIYEMGILNITHRTATCVKGICAAYKALKKLPMRQPAPF